MKHIGNTWLLECLHNVIFRVLEYTTHTHHEENLFWWYKFACYYFHDDIYHEYSKIKLKPCHNTLPKK